MEGSKALIAVTRYSHHTKYYGTILNSFSWPHSVKSRMIWIKLTTKLGFILTSIN